MSAAKIRELNDRFRTTMTGGRVMMTAGVDALPSDVKAMVIRRVAPFSDFTPDNDPHKEHDFGPSSSPVGGSFGKSTRTTRRWNSPRRTLLTRRSKVEMARRRFRHPGLRTGHASFPASGCLCAAHALRVVLMVAMAR